jgi:hypothetical protein
LADETTTTWANLLREMKGPLVEALRWKTVLLSEVKRNKSPQLWHGKQITIPIITAPQQGTVMIGESSTVGTAQTIDDVQANIKTAIIEHTISFTTQVLRAASSDDTSWAQVMPTKMRMAEDAISRVMNEQMCGTGDGSARRDHRRLVGHPGARRSPRPRTSTSSIRVGSWTSAPARPAPIRGRAWGARSPRLLPRPAL